ncbi:GTP cyclohydrolase 1-like [Euphorbia lathyris]|uniref:GTP cyclohydrolase 1-like n=1 Tax=Euphorbia lathyris TaxID=212925 RepID=UPI00331428C2
MGALDEEHFHAELENGLKADFLNLGIEQQPQNLAIQNAVRVLLEGLGENINREGIKKTPLRVAKALLYATKGYKESAKEIIHSALFPEAGLDNAVGHAGGVGGLVIVRDLDLFSYCESCLLPIQVKCHVGYVPSGQRVVGLSKLSRVADVYAKQLQHPQRLANEICSALQQGIKPAGVAVVLHCLHINFPNLESFLIDPNHQGWVKIMVHSGSGVFEDENADIWSDFLSLLKLRGTDVSQMKESPEQCWCPSQSPSNAKFSSKIESPNQEMVSAAASILMSMGEDPLRKELVGTPSRFLKWFMNFQTTHLGMKLNGFSCDGTDSLKVNGDVSQNKEHMCSELNLSLWSQCEHHLLPFYGVVHIGYFPVEGFKPIGKSLLQSIVYFYGFKLQVQERLTKQIAETATSLLGEDVMVVVEANHTCMISRGIEKIGSSTATIAVLGRFATDSAARAKFLQSIPNSSSGGSLLH